MDARDQVSKRIASAVEKLGGVAATANAAGVTEQAVYHWLSGTRPYAKTLRILAEAARLPVDWLSGKLDELPVLGEESPLYGESNPIPVELRPAFSRFAAHYGLSEPDAFRLIFDAFTGRIQK